MNFLKKILVIVAIMIIWAEYNSRVVYEKLINDNIISIEKINMKYGNMDSKDYLEKLYIKNDIIIKRAIVVFQENEDPLNQILKN